MRPAERRATVRRTLPVGPALVYAEWTDPGSLADWMCPRPARCVSVALEPRVGGALRFEIEENGVTFSVWGRFLAMEAPRLLRFTWSCSTWPDPTVESVVTVMLDEVGDGETAMTIEHSGLPAGLSDRHEAGWRAIAAQLGSMLAARA
jgi:uncharacterized protein YndB with AHSA1/START domain